jgi:hypothetical protein
MENNKLYEALAKAQGEFELVAFDKTNPHFKSKFASLASIRKSIQPALSKYGIALLQPWKDLPNGDIIISTILAHASGERIESSCLLVRGAKSDQLFGASVTYMRRYQISSLLGIAAEEDDDGEEDRKVHEAKKKEPVKPVFNESDVFHNAAHLVDITGMDSSMIPQVEDYLRFAYSKLPAGKSFQETIFKWLKDPEPFKEHFNKWLEKQIGSSVS